jgi:polysaccharide export outer membrane protein
MKIGHGSQINVSAVIRRSVMKSSTDFTLGKYLLSALLFPGIAFAQAAPGKLDVGIAFAALSSAPASQDAPPRSDRPDDAFVIGDDDVLAISVWKEPDLTKQVTVRSDGKISLPLIGDLRAAGRTPAQLEMDITDHLKGFITDPQVAVIVQEIHSLKYNILGQVGKPGSYPLNAGITIVDAIAAAGGLKDFAKKKDIYILRQNGAGAESRFSFNYQDFIKGKDTKQNILLKSHDTVVVP